MTITTRHLLIVINILSWIIFVGLCIEAGGFLFNTFYALLRNPNEASFYWDKVDLTPLLKWDRGQFITLTTLMTITAILKATLFYKIIQILTDKKLDMAQPFNAAIGRFVFFMTYLTLAIGFFSSWGIKYTEWLVSKEIKMPEIHYLRFGGADVWLFMGVVLFVIALIFKRGIELQTENDLTV